MKKIRILSLDGGGIRGIIPGVILSYLEKQLQLKDQSSRKIGDYFDFIAGTSTGAILACAYLMPDPNGYARFAADDAVDIYLKEGGDIFHRSLMKRIFSGFGLLDEKFTEVELEKALSDFFEEAMLDTLIKPCLITSYEITARKAHFFNSAEAKDPLYNFKVRDIARATAAAPTYFEPASIYSEAGQNFSLIDGGVFANNPALCAYAEVRKLNFSKILQREDKPDLPSAKDMLMVSVSTGTIDKPYHYIDFENAGEVEWLRPIIDILMSGNSETVDYQLMQMFKTLSPADRDDYYRLEPSLREALPDMDIATLENLENLRQAGLWYVDENKTRLDEIVDKLLENK